MNIHIGEVLIATAASFIVAMLWYSPALFYDAWRKGAKISEKDTKPNAGYIILGIISTFILTYGLNVFITYANATSFFDSLLVAIYTWVGFVASIMMGSVIWEKKPLSYYFINSVYFLVTMCLSAIIFVTV